MSFSRVVYALCSASQLLERLFLYTVLCKRNGPWAVFKSLAVIFFVVVWLRDSQGPRFLQARYSEHECNAAPQLPPLWNRMWPCRLYPVHPYSHLVFIGTDTRWPLHHLNTDKCKYAPMVGQEIVRSNLWTSQRFMAHWKQQGHRNRDMLSLLVRGSSVYKYLESILVCNKTAFQTAVALHVAQ